MSPGVGRDDDQVVHGSSHQRGHRRGYQHRVCQGRDLRCLRHHSRCRRRLPVRCMKAVDYKMVLEMKAAAEQDLLERDHTETCQAEE